MNTRIDRRAHLSNEVTTASLTHNGPLDRFELIISHTAGKRKHPSPLAMVASNKRG